MVYEIVCERDSEDCLGCDKYDVSCNICKELCKYPSETIVSNSLDEAIEDFKTLFPGHKIKYVWQLVREF